MSTYVEYQYHFCYYCGTLSCECECILAEKGMLRGATLWHWNIQCGDQAPSKQQGRPEEIRMLMREMFSLVTIPLCQCASIGLRGLSRTYIQLLLLEDIYYKRNFLASVLGWYYLYIVSLNMRWICFFLTNIPIYLQIVSVSSGQSSPRGGSVGSGEIWLGPGHNWNFQL